MSHFCLDESTNAFSKPQILHTSYLSRRPGLGAPATAPQAGSPWQVGLRVTHGEREDVLEPRPHGPAGRLKLQPRGAQGVEAGANSRRCGARDCGMEGPA